MEGKLKSIKIYDCYGNEMTRDAQDSAYEKAVSYWKDCMSRLNELKESGLELKINYMQDCQKMITNIEKLLCELEQFHEKGLIIDGNYRFNDDLYFIFFINSNTCKIYGHFYIDGDIEDYLYERYYDSHSELNVWINDIMMSGLSVVMAEPRIKDRITGENIDAETAEQVIQIILDNDCWQHKVLSEFYDATIKGAKRYVRENEDEFEW